ncbi:MAG: type II toxin-antitoxin system YoeB family toxin [Candidatus Competibacteraceae bacterium]
MKVAFEKSAFEDFTSWATDDRKIYKRITSLIMDILRQPYSGLGKPEPLKHELPGTGAAAGRDGTTTG